MALSLKKLPLNQDWNTFVAHSPQGNVFCQSEFLACLKAHPEIYAVEENGEIALAAVVVKDQSGKVLQSPFNFCLYQGVLLSGEVEAAPIHGRVGDRLRLLSFLLAELEKQEGRISLSLHHSFPDLRSFSWFHYHEPEMGQFRHQLLYTGVIDLAPYANFEEYLGKIRKTRRNDYRKGVDHGLRAVPSADIDALEKLYRLTFERQNLSLPEMQVQQMRAIAEQGLKAKFAELTFCETAQGERISATLFLHDARGAYYLVAANDPDFRHLPGSTFLLGEGVRRAKERGQVYVDLCGMNSPQRGDFKASFNAAPIPYFVMDWTSPSAQGL